jgi:hypothetical protein
VPVLSNSAFCALKNGKVGMPNDHLHALTGHRGDYNNDTKGRLIDRHAVSKITLIQGGNPLLKGIAIIHNIPIRILL